MNSSRFPDVFITYHVSRFTSHISPVYKHSAPLGLKALLPRLPGVFITYHVSRRTCRPSINMSPRWG